MAEEIEEDKEAKTSKKEREVEEKLPEEKPQEEEPSEEKHPGEAHSEEELPEEEPLEEKPFEEEPLEEELPEEVPSEVKPPVEEPPVEEPPDVKSPQEEPHEEEPHEEKPLLEKSHEEKPSEEEPPEVLSSEEEPHDEEPHEEEPLEEKPFEEEPLGEEHPEEKPSEEELPEEEPPEVKSSEEEPPEEELPEKEPLEEKPFEEEPLEEEPPEEEPHDEELPEEEQSEEKSSEEEPLEVGPPELKEVNEYDAEELKREIERTGFPDMEENSSEMLLIEIKEERRRLEEERAKLREEKEQKDKMIKEREEEEKEEEEKPPIKSKAIKSFAKERRKRKEIVRLRDYLFIGEYLLLVVLVVALLYSEGISFKPNVYLPMESSIYLIIIFFLIFKAEKFYFRFLNMKYSGTVQRKAIGVDHFKAIEMPPMMLTAFIVSVLLIPITSGIINIVIDMISFERSIIPFSYNFTFNLAMFFLASLVISIAWLIFLIRYRNKVIIPELEKIAEPFVIEDVFVITNSGLLISHASIEVKPNMDEDILSSMLTAVKEFVKDSFGSGGDEGELDELQYGKTRVIIEYGKHVYLATVVRGQESMDLRPEMKRMLKQIQRKFGHVFDTWDGDLGQLKGIEYLARSLVKSI